MRAVHRPGLDREYLPAGQIEQVLCDGENYGGARPCHFEWVKSLRDECAAADVTFRLSCGTGRCFVKDGKTYRLEGRVQSEQAHKSGLSFQGKPMDLKLTDGWGYPYPGGGALRSVFWPSLRTLRHADQLQRLQPLRKMRPAHSG